MKTILKHWDLSALNKTQADGDEKEALSVFMVAVELLFVKFWNDCGNTEERDKAANPARRLYERSVQCG